MNLLLFNSFKIETKAEVPASEQRFKLAGRSFRERNPFNPIISGRVQADARTGTTKIHLRVRPQMGALFAVLLLSWFGVGGAATEVLFSIRTGSFQTPLPVAYGITVLLAVWFAVMTELCLQIRNAKRQIINHSCSLADSSQLNWSSAGFQTCELTRSGRLTSACTAVYMTSIMVALFIRFHPRPEICLFIGVFLAAPFGILLRWWYSTIDNAQVVGQGGRCPFCRIACAV